MASSSLKIPHSKVGVSITPGAIQGVVFSARDFQIQAFDVQPLPAGTLSDNGDLITDPAYLASAVGALANRLKLKGKAVHLSVPATLMRLVEMPKIGAGDMALSISSEAEGYKFFDNTEAAVTFMTVDGGSAGANTQRVVFGAIRNDTLQAYLAAFRQAKIKVASIDFETTNVLRGMAGTGILDNLVQQIGADAYWGTLMVNPDRIRFTLWQGNQLIELRDAGMDTRGLANASADALILDDIVEEIRRTVKNNVPAIWLTEHLPEPTAQILMERLYTPFRPCPADPATAEQYPGLSLATIGSALRSSVVFPFDFNLLQVGGQGGSKDDGRPGDKAADAPMPVALGEKAPPSFAMTAGVLSILLMGLLGAGLKVTADFILAGKERDVTSRKSAAEMQVQGLTAQINKMKVWASLEQSAQGILRQAHIRNRVYVKLAEDLVYRTPEQVWVHSAKIDNAMVLEGKALSHQAVMNFARIFDPAAYVNAVMVEKIQEDLVGSTRVFNYKLQGPINLNPDLLSTAPSVADLTPVAEKIERVN